MRQTLKEESYCYSILDECCREKLSRQEGQSGGWGKRKKRVPGGERTHEEALWQEGTRGTQGTERSWSGWCVQRGPGVISTRQAGQGQAADSSRSELFVCFQILLHLSDPKIWGNVPTSEEKNTVGLLFYCKALSWSQSFLGPQKPMASLAQHLEVSLNFTLGEQAVWKEEEEGFICQKQIRIWKVSALPCS